MLFLQILLNTLVFGTQVLLLAAGLYLIHTVGKVYHVALGAMSTATAYAFYAFYRLGSGELLATLGGLCLGGLLGLITFFLMRKFIDAEQDLLALLTSLTVGVAMESIMGIVFGPEGRFLLPEVLPVYNFSGLHLTKVGLLTIVAGLAIALAAYVFLHLLPWGRLLRAISQHRLLAAIMGINEYTVKLLVFVGVGILAGIVGILSGLNNAITPGAGFYPVITAFIALLVGGISDFRGTVVATFILVLIPELVIALGGNLISISVTWKMVLVFVLALVLLTVRPHGLFSSINRKS